MSNELPLTEERKAELDDCVKRLLNSGPKSRQGNYIGEANELWCFIAALPRAPKRETPKMETRP